MFFSNLNDFSTQLHNFAQNLNAMAGLGFSLLNGYVITHDTFRWVKDIEQSFYNFLFTQFNLFAANYQHCYILFVDFKQYQLLII